MMRSNTNYLMIGLIIFAAALVLITAGHWNEVSSIFQNLGSIFSNDIAPAIIMVLGIGLMISAIF